MSADPAAVADALLAARKAHRKLTPLPSPIRPADEAAGIAAQVALARKLEAVPPAGFKIGATTKKMQEFLHLTEPIAGFMAVAGVYQSGVKLPFTDFQSVAVEGELAVTLVRDLPPGESDPHRVAAAVGAISAGIEIVENRYPPLEEFGTPALIADQMFHAAAVVGPPDTEWRKLDLKKIKGCILIDQEERGSGRGDELMGDPLAALAWLAGSPFAAAFGGLKAGQVVMLGSVTPPIWLSSPAEVKLAFPPLDPVHLTFT